MASSARRWCSAPSTTRRAINEGIELSLKYTNGNFQAYANLAVAQQKATNVVSNQYLFDNTTPLADLGGLTEFQYIATHWIYTDHNQFVTASAGAIYQFCGRPATAAEMFGVGGMWPTFNSWCGTRLSADMIYGSGLRNGDANIGTVAPYAQFNVGVAREFLLPGAPSRRRCGSTSSTCSTASIRSATAAASACSRRNSARAAATTPASRRNSEAANRDRVNVA